MNFYLYYAIIIPMRRTRMIQFNIDFFYINSHLDRGRNSAWSWREARLCFTKTRKHTEANQRRPSEARPPWILSAAWPRLQLTTQRRNMSSDWSEYPRVECCLYHPLSLSLQATERRRLFVPSSGRRADESLGGGHQQASSGTGGGPRQVSDSAARLRQERWTQAKIVLHS